MISLMEYVFITIWMEFNRISIVLIASAEIEGTACLSVNVVPIAPFPLEVVNAEEVNALVTARA